MYGTYHTDELDHCWVYGTYHTDELDHCQAKLDGDGFGEVLHWSNERVVAVINE